MARLPLTWCTDPLLVDEEPTSYNKWVTANGLITKNGLERVLQRDLSFTNLYGILIRKMDFVREKKNDRILARFPFLVLTEEQKEYIDSKDLLIAEVVRDYFYQSINKSISQWRERLQSFLERGTIPLPIFRAATQLVADYASNEERVPFSCKKKKKNIPFTSARGEQFTFPTKLSKKLAYLCGICNGDGNLRKYWIIVVDETKKHILFINELFEELFGKSGKIIKNGGAWLVKLNLLWAVRLVNFLTNQPINKPKYASLQEPLVFKQLSGDFRGVYWRGLMDSDGSYSKYAVNFTTASRNLKNDFCSFLDDWRISYNFKKTIYKQQKAEAYTIYILANSQEAFCKRIGSNHLKKQKLLERLLTRKKNQRLKGAILGLKNERLTSTGMFDFTYTPSLRIKIPEVLNKKVIDKLFSCSMATGMSSSPLRKYKKGHLAIPLSKLQLFVQESYKTLDMNQFLRKYKIRLFHLGKTTAKLPLQPSKKLEQLLKGLRMRKGYLLIKKVPNKTKEEFKEEIKQFFQIKTPKNKLWNAVMLHFVKTFFQRKKEKESKRLLF